MIFVDSMGILYSTDSAEFTEFANGQLMVIESTSFTRETNESANIGLTAILLKDPGESPLETIGRAIVCPFNSFR